jgi:hypothetical protein
MSSLQHTACFGPKSHHVASDKIYEQADEYFFIKPDDAVLGRNMWATVKKDIVFTVTCNFI